jgi:hypothetical protein
VRPLSRHAQHRCQLSLVQRAPGLEKREPHLVNRPDVLAQQEPGLLLALLE